jgi:DNA-binding CsgD family transcriptional regulator
MALGRSDRRAVAEIAAMARTIDDEPRPILEQIMPRLQGLLRADFAVGYRTSPVDETGGWTIDFMNVHGEAPSFRAPFEHFLVSAPPRRFCWYDPISPEPSDRDVVRHPTVEIAERELLDAPVMRQAFAPAGMERYDQMRLLLCDGPMLMAWLGGIRRERFTGRERSILESLMAPLRARLRLERRLLRAELLERGLVAALEATATTAFLCTRDGQIAYTTDAARARLDAEEPLRGRLHAALRGDARAAATAVSLRVPGLPEHVLVSFATPLGARSFDARLEAAQRAWRLTRRQGQVLERLVHGESNKQIAERFHCAENTIEVHVSALLRKARAQSRAALASRFWTAIEP